LKSIKLFKKRSHNPFNRTWKILIFALLLISICNLVAPIESLFGVLSKNRTECQCVVFRLDDIQDNFLNRSQLAVMNLFLEKNQALSLALILNALGNDTTVINKIHEGYKASNFELSSHGWNHENFSKLNENEQVDLLNKASDKMHRLFGIFPIVFIPPFYEFNNSTLDASREAGVKIISSLDKFYEHRNQSDLITNIKNPTGKTSDGILHFPTTLQYSYSDGISWNTYSVNQSLQKIHDSILTRGYAVVTLHPQGFANVINGNLTNSVNATQVNKLAKIMDSLLNENKHTTLFYKLGEIANAKNVTLDG